MFVGCACVLVGNLRRLDSDVAGKENAAFFDFSNEVAVRRRELLALSVFENLLEWMNHCPDAQCGIFDATNTTIERRAWVLDACKRQGIDVLFVESSVTDPR